MLINRDYLLKRPSGPSASKQFLDQKILPLAVNALGRVEVAISRTSARTSVRSAVIVASMVAVVSISLARLLGMRNQP